MPRSLLLGFAAAAFPVLSAAAQPATPEEASRLTSVFERYVGRPAPGEPPHATVTPQGDSYAVTVDLKRALAGFQGFSLDPYSISMTLTPGPDGTWRVRSEDGAPLVVHLGEETGTFSAKTSTFDGTFDPRLGTFSAFKREQTGASSLRVSPTATQDWRFDSSTMSGKGVPAEAGTVSTSFHSTGTGVSIESTFRSPAPPGPQGGNPAVPPPPRPSVALAYSAPATQGDGAVERLDTVKLLELWAFLVAHPDRASLAASQTELKGLLRAGLPYVGAVRQSGTLDTVSAATPIGTVTARSAKFDLQAEGLGGTGRLGVGLSVADLAVPSGQLPPWSSGLVPTALDLHVALEGFHATDAARALVDGMDLGKDVAVTPEQRGQVSRLLWPGDGSLTLKPSRIATPMLDLTVDGRATLGPQPVGQITVSAKGLDKEIAALQAQAATDPGAGQVLGPLALAKGLGKAGADGSLVWVIAFGDGPVTVNGAPLQ